MAKEEKAGRKRARREERAAASDARAAASEPPAQAGPDRFDFFEQARDWTPYLGVTTEAGRFLVATTDRGVGRSLFVKSSRPEFRVLGRAVDVIEAVLGADAVAGRSFIDVGAHIGTTSVCALVSHRFGSAVACEPEAENHQLLRANLALNGLSNRGRAVRAAVSSQVGRASFVVVEDRKGSSWIASDPAKIDAAEAVRARRIAEDPAALDDPRPLRPSEVSEMTVVDVETVTLDHLVETGVVEADRAAMAWIDAEGHEGHILEGGSALIERGVPAVLEFHPGGDDRADRERIHAIAEQHYSHFVDVRRKQVDKARPRIQLRPVGELREYAERFLNPSSPVAFTDILLLRLDDAQAGAWARRGG